MAEKTRHRLRTEARIFLIISVGAFALGLAIGFAVLGAR